MKMVQGLNPGSDLAVPADVHTDRYYADRLTFGCCAIAVRGRVKPSLQTLCSIEPFPFGLNLRSVSRKLPASCDDDHAQGSLTLAESTEE